MARNPNRILVIDLECTCWDGPDNQVYAGKGEIIEIGLVEMRKRIDSRGETDWDVSGGVSIVVKPAETAVSPFCTQLTGWTQEQVDQGTSFGAACYLLRNNYCSEDAVFASFGDFDRLQFERECKRKGVKYPFGPTHLNVKNLAVLQYKGGIWLDREVGMPRAVSMYGLQQTGRHHNGKDDAENIARLLKKLLT